MDDYKYFKEFGKHLKKLRELAGKTQLELAVEAEMSLSHYSGIEQGKNNPTLKQLRKIALVLNLHARELVL
jgi:transcriptional regulator with XRE-family HTH domain